MLLEKIDIQKNNTIIFFKFKLHFFMFLILYSRGIEVIICILTKDLLIDI